MPVLTSVRLRLLILALLPLVVLMPLLLLLATSRWTSDYDKLLIVNVESDLRIAEQYLGRILVGTGAGLERLADGRAFEVALRGTPEQRQAFLDLKREELGLDFLYLHPGDAPSPWPVIQTALGGAPSTAIDIFPAETLAGFSDALAGRARIELIETEAAVPTERRTEDRGMVVHSASPVRLPGFDGALVGGILLNRNLGFIDTINTLVYLNAVTGGERQGTATLFLDDVRVSTNVRLFEDVRALGTRVSASVRHAVLNEGQTWLARAFVVNDWYISGYLPLSDSFGERVGMLYVGFLEAPFTRAKRAALMVMLAAFGAVLLLSGPIFLRMAKGVFAPLERMTQTMRRVEQGDLAARNGDVGARDEIGQVSRHLDTLLDQVQERDRALRDRAGELNIRVDQRTAELKEANRKLEETFKQLVMSEKLASIGEITAGVAHEINNPVAVIQGNVDVMREALGPQIETVQVEMDLIDRQVQRIDAIVAKLLKFARPDEFGADENNVDVAALTEECLALIDRVYTGQHIRIERDMQSAPAVRINTGELQQVIVNLLVNAVQAMDGAGTLSLSLSAETREGRAGACLRVADTGPGIPEAALDRLFDPFYTTKLGEGTGLGLSISQTLIQRADGLISAFNRPCGGAEFELWLPAAELESVK